MTTPAMTSTRGVSSVAALALPSIHRSAHMVRRNLVVYRHLWSVLATGFFEPVFYLFGVGIGLGRMIGEVGGIPYPAFVVGGLLAVSCLNGALTDAFFNIFFKLRYKRTYDGILATPMRVADIAFGEMLWALGRGTTYAALFVLVALGAGVVLGQPLILSWWAAMVVPASVLVSASFSSMALAAMSFVKKVQDFDVVVGLVVTPMFLFSGTFFPVSQFPDALEWFVLIVPLYHGVELLRQLTTGTVSVSIAGHIVYLAAGGVIAFAVAMVRIERVLIK
jgi:lipooligosaccharide transport system permease protein